MQTPCRLLASDWLPPRTAPLTGEGEGERETRSGEEPPHAGGTEQTDTQEQRRRENERKREEEKGEKVAGPKSTLFEEQSRRTLCSLEHLLWKTTLWTTSPPLPSTLHGAKQEKKA